MKKDGLEELYEEVDMTKIEPPKPKHWLWILIWGGILFTLLYFIGK